MLTPHHQHCTNPLRAILVTNFAGGREWGLLRSQVPRHNQVAGISDGPRDDGALAQLANSVRSVLTPLGGRLYGHTKVHMETSLYACPSLGGPLKSESGGGNWVPGGGQMGLGGMVSREKSLLWCVFQCFIIVIRFYYNL